MYVLFFALMQRKEPNKNQACRKNAATHARAAGGTKAVPSLINPGSRSLVPRFVLRHVARKGWNTPAFFLRAGEYG